MNSRTENSKPDSAQEISPREMMEAAISASVMEIIQLRRTLWLVLKQVGKPVILDETECHPLWRMKGKRLDDGKAELEAVTLPEPTNDALNALVEILNGSMTDLETAMEQTELKDHPPAYIQMRLQPMLVRRDDGYWVDAVVHNIQQQPPSERN